MVLSGFQPGATTRASQRTSGSKPKHYRLMIPALYRFMVFSASSSRGFMQYAPDENLKKHTMPFPLPSIRRFFRWSKGGERGIVGA